MNRTEWPYCLPNNYPLIKLNVLKSVFDKTILKTNHTAQNSNDNNIFFYLEFKICLK